jgi:hypothetical protein
VIYVVAFDPIKIMTCWALQNDCQNLSFVKATNAVSKKMAGNTCKMAISYLCRFRFETEFTTTYAVAVCTYVTLLHLNRLK